MAQQNIGRYVVERELGRGGMAVVYLARDPLVNRQVAIKVLPQAYTFDPHFRSRFQREAEIVAALDHPFVVPLLDVGEHQGQPFLVMRYMPGGSLHARLEQGALALPRLVPIALRVAEALDEAHARGIIHRDLKPANILFDARGDAYLSDFGIAKMTAGPAGLTGVGIIGTPEYMSPEQIQAEKELDGRSDVYSLGIVVFHSLTGRPPYTANSPTGVMMAHLSAPVPRLREARPDLPPACDSIVARAMAKDPAARYPSAGALARDLQRTIAGSGGPPTRLEAPAGGLPTLLVPTAEQNAATELLPASADRTSPRPRAMAPPAPSPLPAPVPPSRRGLWIGLIVAGFSLLLVLLVGGAAITVLSGLSRGATRTAEAASISLGPTAVLPAASSAPTLAASGTPAPTAVPTGTPLIPPSATAPEPSPAAPEPTPSPTVETGPVAGATAIGPVDGAVEVYVPEGEFLMGSAAGEAGAEDDEQPQRMVRLDAFYVDQFEVTNALYRRCVEAGACNAPRHTGNFNNPSKADHPVVYVNWGSALTYCTWAGKRLPTEAQWEKAARGPDGRPYPWGDAAPSPALLNFNRSVSDTTAVGSYPDGASPYGAFDLAGNVMEWVADSYDANYYASAPADNPLGPSMGDTPGLRGGAWDSPAQAVRAANRGRTAETDANNTIGFRCARSP